MLVANPAELLFNNLVQWNPPNISTQTAPASYRNLKTNREHVLRMHEITMGYIAQIRELLDTLEQKYATSPTCRGGGLASPSRRDTQSPNASRRIRCFFDETTQLQDL